jgi:hypothetical protein
MSVNSTAKSVSKTRTYTTATTHPTYQPFLGYLRPLWIPKREERLLRLLVHMLPFRPCLHHQSLPSWHIEAIVFLSDVLTTAVFRPSVSLHSTPMTTTIHTIK